MITSNASEKIHQFNKTGLHYNLVADQVYKAHEFEDDYFSRKYQSFITAALISFDMNRMMGKGSKYKL